MRLEKAYRLWGVDMSADYTPLEAGLDRFVALRQGRLHRPRRAAAASASAGVERTLACLTIETDDADAHGYEPVRRGGAPIGYVAAGGYGHVVEQSIALAYLPVEHAEPGRSSTVDILGEPPRGRGRRPAALRPVQRAPLLDRPAESRYEPVAPSRPARWDLVPGHTALVAIDVQNDFLHADGWYATSGIDIAHMRRVIEPTQRLVAACRAARRPGRSGRATAPRRRGRRAVHAAAAVPARRRPARRAPGATRSSTSFEPPTTTGSSRRTGSARSSTRTSSSCSRGLHAETVLITGVLTNQCVAATSKDAMFRDFKPIVVEDVHRDDAAAPPRARRSR